MPSRPIEAHPRRDNRHKPTRSHHHTPRQHGPAHGTLRAASGTADVLLSIPSESLTHVTAFLDPPDLLALARTCKQLHAHVADDNTWRRAYVHQYLDITPESDLRDDVGDKTFMLRREEGSWRKEFIQRYNLRRRWEYSRNSTITHIPHHSPVSAVHLMPHMTLLAASLQYGVVSRSYPLSGKILRGFLDASGTLNGLGIGNPNAEFSPHVSSIALASEGGTAQVLWGFRNGEVAVTTALRTMDHNRSSAARLIRCRLGDCHEGAVETVAWVSGGGGHFLFVSGSADGSVKLWQAKTSVQCLWTSNKRTSHVSDSCVKVIADVQRGVIAAGFRSGNVLVWTGFTSLSSEGSEASALEPQELRIPAPAATPAPEPHANTPLELTDLRIAPQGQELSFLVAYHPSPYFHRLSLSGIPGGFERTLFGDESTGPISAIYPVWASRTDEYPFVITGDQAGNVSIFRWDARLIPSESSASSELGSPSIHAVRRFVAHEDGAVTALAWNSAVLISGSSRGTIRAWDALTFAPLRSFSSPATRPFAGVEWDGVTQILLERDALVASIGSRVLAWKAGPVSRSAAHNKGKNIRNISGRNNNGVAKWQQQIEMYRDIAEFKRELEEEQAYSRQAFGREKDQLSTLAHLGLSEVEAVEYVLMLSRDEEEARTRRGVAGSSVNVFRDHEGVFSVDFDEVPTPMATRSNVFGSESCSVISRTSSFSTQSSPSRTSGSYIDAAPVHPSRVSPYAAPSSSNHKVQISPRLCPEPAEAGASFSAGSNSLPGANPPVSDSNHFPAVRVSRTSSSASASGSSAKGSVPSSPQSARSAWSTPLRSMHSSGAASPPSGAASMSPAYSPALSGALGLGRQGSASYEQDEDRDLRFAIELSLAEARSRGENV